MNENHYAIIMAGGVGSRFWPVSTWAFPKQFHDMLGSGQTLLQQTYHRLAKFIPKENILISTNEIYKNLVKNQLPGIDDENLVLEPSMRNTAPCILYATMKIQKRNPNAVLIVAPSDHWIEQEDEFEENVKDCFTLCESQDILMTLGIKPTFPNTGYGYIQYNKTDQNKAKKVLQFTEKPNYGTAKQFLNEGNYLWNAGIFIWRSESVLNAFKKYQPKMYELFDKGKKSYNTEEEWSFIKENYINSENISVDYAIMDPSDNIYVFPVGFDWNDLGTWGSLHEKLAKDSDNNAVVNALTLFKNASDNIIRTDTNKVVIVDGIEHYIIVDTASVLMIYPKEKEQSIKQLLEEVKNKFGNNLS